MILPILFILSLWIVGGIETKCHQEQDKVYRLFYIFLVMFWLLGVLGIIVVNE